MTHYHLLKIAGFIILFWIGIYFWQLGKAYDYRVSTSCIADYCGRIYLVGVKDSIIHGGDERRIIKSVGKIGKAIDAAATKIERAEARNAIRQEFRDPNFSELAKRIISASEYHRYLEAYDLIAYENMSKMLKKYLLHLYNKSK